MANPITTIANAITGGNGNSPAVELRTFRYRCKCDCTFGGDYHRQGDIIVSDKKLEVPHFEPVENKKE